MTDRSSKKQGLPDETIRLYTDVENVIVSPALYSDAVSMACEIQRLREALRALAMQSPVETSGEWRPIDTAPRNYTAILLKDGSVIGEGCHASHLDIWEFFNSAHVMRRNPTHWQPLPGEHRFFDGSGEKTTTSRDLEDGVDELDPPV